MGERIEGNIFWPEARKIMEDFPSAVRVAANQHADELGLKGLRRFATVAIDRIRISKLETTFAMASLTRAAFSSQETAPQLLKTLAYPNKNI